MVLKEPVADSYEKQAKNLVGRRVSSAPRQLCLGCSCGLPLTVSQMTRAWEEENEDLIF
jgi:hypothetical protein